MDFRLAVMQDLAELKAMYSQIVKNMNENGIQIWDDIYPCEFFRDDIKKNQMYVLLRNNEIIAAFVLSDTNVGETAVEWSDSHAKVLYLDRLGVNPKCAKKGIGSLMFAKAKETAKILGAEYLRLFVVDRNTPAIWLYNKNGCIKAKGVYKEVFDDGFALHEFGYEIKL